MSKPETKFRVNQVDPFLAKLPQSWFESVQQVAIGGTPDKLGCIRGRFVAIELKAEDGTLSPRQRSKLKKIAKIGGVAIVCRPQNWKEVQELLTALSKGESIDVHNQIFGDGFVSVPTSSH